MQCGYLRNHSQSLCIIILSLHFCLVIPPKFQPHLKWGIKPFSNLGRQPKAARSLSEVSADLCFYLKALQTLNLCFMHDKRSLFQSHRPSVPLWVYFFAYLTAVEQLYKCCICGLVRPSNVSGNETNAWEENT